MRYSLVAALFALSLAAAAPVADKPQKYVVTISNMAFAPGALSIKAGDSVYWKNDDDRDHSVTSADGTLKSGNIKPGGTFSYTFKKPGNYAYGCGYHPRMKAGITVKE